MPASYRLLDRYPFDWTGLEDFSAYSFDEQGIPRVQDSVIGWYYNPITIAQYGLVQSQRFYQTKDPACKSRALTCGFWLRENGVKRPDGALVWLYDLDLAFYGLRAPWMSAMAQGEAISLLLRCSRWQDQDAYLAAAQAARRVFDHSVAEQGVVGTILPGHEVFEEYPTQPASHVLNGHIFSLLGLYDYACWSQKVEDRQRVEAGLQTCVQAWRNWDVGYWTLYDLHPSRRLASRMYHQVHIRQMHLLAALFESPQLEQVAQRWERMLKSPWCSLRWLAAKILEKVRI